MLLLLTIGLVVIAAVALVIGFVTSALGPIYISIACSVLAAIVLLIFSRLSKREGAPAPAARPAPVPAAAPERARPAEREPVLVPDREREPVSVGAGGGGESRTFGYQPPAWEQRGRPDDTLEDIPREREADEDREAAPSMASDDGDYRPEPSTAAPLPAFFPIEDYDELRVSEIMPLLPQLDPGELEDVRDREQAGKARGTILRRIDQLAASAARSGAAPSDVDEREPVTVAGPQAGGEDAFGDGADGEDFEDDGAAPMFPIADYDELRVGEIVPLLPELDPDELEMVRRREQQGKSRARILMSIAQLEGAPAAGAVSDGPLAEEPLPEPDLAATEDIDMRAFREEVGLEADAAAYDDGIAVDDGAGVFPIADYDELRVSQIMPLLGQLEPDELVVVAERERAGKARGTILNRIDQLSSPGRRRAAAEPATPAPAVPLAMPAAEPEPEPVAVAPEPAARPDGDAPAAPRRRRAPAKASAPAAEPEPAPAPARRSTRAAKVAGRPAAKASPAPVPTAETAPARARSRAGAAAAAGAAKAAKAAKAPRTRAAAKAAPGKAPAAKAPGRPRKSGAAVKK